MKRLPLFLLAACAALLPSTIEAQTLDVWSVDPHEKIFTDAEPCDAPTVALAAAANEYESAQFALRADSDLTLKLSASALKNEETSAEIEASAVRLRPIGMIPIARNTELADDLIVRKAPCDIPEILWEKDDVQLKAGESQGVWVTVFVPKGTAAGKYAGTISIKGGSVEKALPIELEVFPFELPEEKHLYITNWWFERKCVDYAPKGKKIEYFTEEYWDMLDSYMKNMGEHRQNVSLIEWIPNASGSLIVASVDKEGKWSFDFSRFERFLQLLEKNGLDARYELTHIGGIDREKHVVKLHETTVMDEATGEPRAASFDEWFEPAFKAVCDYMRKTGRFERTMLHVADEPYLPDVKSWREVAARIKAIEPEIKLIDAIEAINFSGLLDVWVPKISHLERWRSAFEARRANNEFWYYICCHPYGSTYPNRFIDLPVVRVRSLFWVNYVENLTGYLHWGYNYWIGDAFGAPTEMYAPGDGHVVYPSENGPLDSIRWEMQRESAEDYEYLKLLETSVEKVLSGFDPEKVWAFDPKSRSMELAKRVAPDMTHTTLDVKTLEDARREIVNDIEAATGELKLIVQTFPEDNAIVCAGPVLGELYGITTPGATVTCADEPVEVDEEGFFTYQIYPSSKFDTPVSIVATLGDKTVKTMRYFHINKNLAKEQ